MAGGPTPFARSHHHHAFAATSAFVVVALIEVLQPLGFIGHFGLFLPLFRWAEPGSAMPRGRIRPSESKMERLPMPSILLDLSRSPCAYRRRPSRAGRGAGRGAGTGPALRRLPVASWTYAGGSHRDPGTMGVDGFIQPVPRHARPGVHHVTFKVPDLTRSAGGRAPRLRDRRRDRVGASWKEAFFHPKQALASSCTLRRRWLRRVLRVTSRRGARWGLRPCDLGCACAPIRGSAPQRCGATICRP